MDKKIIIIIVLLIGLVVSISDIVYLHNKYETNEHAYKNVSDSLCVEIDNQIRRYDSLKIHGDSLYSYELNRNDSLYQILQTNQKTNKTKITYIYKDSTIIKEGEQTEIQTVVETKYVDRIVEKEVIQVIHDTVMVNKVDTMYKENKVEVYKDIEEKNKEVVQKEDLFNVYVDANVKGNLDFDVIPEVGAGIMIKEKYYGQIQIDYDNGKVNPSIKAGIHLNLF